MTATARLLGEEDEAALEAFLAPHTPWAYFMRSNLRLGGILYRGEAYQSDYFGAFDGDRLVGALAHSWLGTMQYFAPDSEAAPPLAAAWRHRLTAYPRPITHLLGPADHIDRLAMMFDWSGIVFRAHAHDEVLCTLPLGALRLPPVLAHEGIRLDQAQNDDAELLTQWRHDFNCEASGDPPGEATLKKARDEIERRIAVGDLFILRDGSEPVSFCGAGGFLPDWKIVGPVWTPPALRGRGYAKAVTAGALLRLREAGAQHAVLFGSRPDALQAYRALGFTVAGAWRLDVLHQPITALKLAGRTEEA